MTQQVYVEHGALACALMGTIKNTRNTFSKLITAPIKTQTNQQWSKKIPAIWSRLGAASKTLLSETRSFARLVGGCLSPEIWRPKMRPIRVIFNPRMS
jgi:hypothetical protein